MVEPARPKKEGEKKLNHSEKDKNFLKNKIDLKIFFPLTTELVGKLSQALKNLKN